jgi:phage FluMu protein Com
MDLRCTFCQTMFALSRDDTLAALEHMEEHHQTYYDAHCPKCRRANRVERFKLEFSYPNWREVIAAKAKETPVAAPIVTETTAPAPAAVPTPEPVAVAVPHHKHSHKPAATVVAKPVEKKATPAPKAKPAATSSPKGKPAAKKAPAKPAPKAKPAAKKPAAKPAVKKPAAPAKGKKTTGGAKKK